MMVVKLFTIGQDFCNFNVIRLNSSLWMDIFGDGHFCLVWNLRVPSNLPLVKGSWTISSPNIRVIIDAVGFETILS